MSAELIIVLAVAALGLMGLWRRYRKAMEQVDRLGDGDGDY